MNRSIPLIVLGAFALALLLVGLPASAAYAADPPWPAGIPWPTSVPWPTASPLTIGVPWSPSSQSLPVYATTPVPPAISMPVAGPLPLPPVVVSGGVAQPAIPPPIYLAPVGAAPPLPDSSGGSTRSSAFVAGDTWRTLAAGGVVWYRVGASGEHMEVWLDASPHSGVSMDIFAPNGGDHPIGRGTPSNADSARMLWSGGHWSGDGYWYARITNGNPISVQYRVTSSQQDISNRSCWSYWEYIGTAPVYWTECNR